MFNLICITISCFQIRMLCHLPSFITLNCVDCKIKTSLFLVFKDNLYTGRPFIISSDENWWDELESLGPFE